ncbi:VOC family protein [Alloalcanivorax sp. C16-1]|uniref:VOC family protein n=1 Tax=Alloalcanivorax sp. C16-1 TaxID=3390051 RepID=UPI003970DF93
MSSFTLRDVVITAHDMESLIADAGAFSARIAFRDGDRYAAVDRSDLSLGVTFAAPEDHPAPGEMVLTAKAESVEAAVAELVASGAEVIREPCQGAHEVRALVRTAGGLLITVYGARA